MKTLKELINKRIKANEESIAHWYSVDNEHKLVRTLEDKNSALKYVLRDIELLEIRKYCNRHIGSDCAPFEVIKVISETCVEVRAMKSEQTVFPKDFHPGGFCGHFADNDKQDYKYTSIPDAKTVRVRFSKANREWRGKGMRFTMCDKPVKFHDYNF